jgi:hypothetical protein
MDFTGERFVPGSTSGLLEAEHVQRYTFASNYAKGKSVLDIACGAGYGSYLLRAGGQLVLPAWIFQQKPYSSRKTITGATELRS